MKQSAAVKTCGKRVSNGFCTRGPGHSGSHRCNVADLEAGASKAASFAAVLIRSAERLEGLPAEYERLGYSGVYARGKAAQTAPALRRLATIISEIERGTSDEYSADDFCNRIAAGFSHSVVADTTAPCPAGCAGGSTPESCVVCLGTGVIDVGS